MIRAAVVAASAVLLLGTVLAPTAQAASETAIERLSTFAMILGRGIGCNLDTKRAAAMLSKWFDEAFPPESGEQKHYLPRFATEVEQYSMQQRRGDSPDSCADVAQAFLYLATAEATTGCVITVEGGKPAPLPT